MLSGKIPFCTGLPSDIKSETGTETNELKIINKYGRRISVLWVNTLGNLILDSHIDPYSIWIKNEANENSVWVVADEYGQVVPINGKCYFKMGSTQHEVEASFGI